MADPEKLCKTPGELFHTVANGTDKKEKWLIHSFPRDFIQRFHKDSDLRGDYS